MLSGEGQIANGLDVGTTPGRFEVVGELGGMSVRTISIVLLECTGQMGMRRGAYRHREFGEDRLSDQRVTEVVGTGLIHLGLNQDVMSPKVFQSFDELGSPQIAH